MTEFDTPQAPDTGVAVPGEVDDQADAKVAEPEPAEAADDTSVADQHTVMIRPDGSKYIVGPEDQPEADDHRAQAPSDTP
jgi:hypothetical protein